MFYGVLKRVILRRRLAGKRVVMEKTKQAACVPTIGTMHDVSEFTFQLHETRQRILLQIDNKLSV